jgi:hypothetical protein
MLSVLSLQTLTAAGFAVKHVSSESHAEVTFCPIHRTSLPNILEMQSVEYLIYFSRASPNKCFMVLFRSLQTIPVLVVGLDTTLYHEMIR